RQSARLGSARLSPVLLVLAHSEDRESGDFMRLVHCLESTHLLPAWRTPRSPEVDDHWTTLVVAQSNRGAIGVMGDKIWRRLPRRQKALGLLRLCRLGWVSPRPLP